MRNSAPVDFSGYVSACCELRDALSFINDNLANLLQLVGRGRDSRAMKHA
jgi:hypothetical protein